MSNFHFLNLIGNKELVNTASYRILSILLKNGYASKIMPVSPINWESDIQKAIQDCHKINTTQPHVVITKCTDIMTDEEFTKLNRYIRNKGYYIQPRALYIKDSENDTINFFEKYSQVNAGFNINDSLEKQKKELEILFEL